MEVVISIPWKRVSPGSAAKQTKQKVDPKELSVYFLTGVFGLSVISSRLQARF